MNFNDRSWKYWTEPEIIEVEGRKLALRRAGSGEPLLFLHGAGLTRQWLPFYNALAKYFTVIVPEHPGYGDSPMSPEMASIDDLVLHYDAVLRHLEIEDPHLVGHSLGGWIAASLALHYPERFRSLSLLSPMGLRTPGISRPDPFRLDSDEADDILLNGLAATYEDFLVQEGPLEDFLREYTENVSFARWTWNPRYDVRLEWRLSRIKIPTTVIHFADDRFIPRESSLGFADLLPNAKFMLFDNPGTEVVSHLALLQYPQELADLIAVEAETRVTSGLVQKS